jgi:putative SOS response-associated peptidase YedK
MKWGLIPHWAKDAKIGFKTINARSEEVINKPSFRGAYKNKRCLIPATGFYEWHGTGKTKVPYLFLLRDRKMFSFAGLYDIWINEGGRQIYTYTILTTKANGVVEKVHDRMPVILAKRDEEIWADNSTFDPATLATLFKPFPEDYMDIYRVGIEVNNPKNKSPETMKAI